MLKTPTIRDNHSNATAPPSTMDCLQDDNEVFNRYQREVNMGIRGISSSFIFYMMLAIILEITIQKRLKLFPMPLSLIGENLFNRADCEDFSQDDQN